MVAYPREPGDSRATRRLNMPRPASVDAPGGVPVAVGGVPVTSVREEWRVADRWWTESPVRRTYFEVVLASGENAVVFVDALTHDWYRQRA